MTLVHNQRFSPNWSTPILFAVAAVLVGCEPTDTTPDATGSSSSSSSSGNSNGLCGGTGVPPNAYEPLSAVPACAAPTATKLDVQIGYVYSPELVSCGGIVGLAFSAGQANITFQALDSSGALLGDPILVSNPANSSVPKVSIASNRKGFMVCWSGWDEPLSIQCGAVDPDQRTVTVGAIIPGWEVDVSWGVGGYMAVYTDPTTKAIKAHRLGDDANFVGDPIELGSTTELRPEVVAQGANYVYVAPDVFGEIDGMTLQPIGAPNVATGINDAIFQRIAATSKTSAILQRTHASVVAAGTTQTSPLVNLATTPVAPTRFDLAVADGSFVAIWGAGSVMRYRAFDEVGSPLGPNEVDLFSDDSNFSGAAIVGTNKGFVVAGSHLGSVSIAHVACP